MRQTMFYFVRTTIVGFALCVLIHAPRSAARAEPIIGLSVNGNAAINLTFDGTNLATTGPQSTEVWFEGFLDGLDDIATPTATFTMDGLTIAGPAVVLDTQVIQQFTGGSFSLYDPDSTLLLSGDLLSPALTGTIGLADGMLFTTSFSTVTGGTLAAGLDSASLIVQMHLSDIGGAGVSITPSLLPSGQLNSFSAIATVDIEAELVPEPATIVLLLLGLARPLVLLAIRLHQRR